VVGLREGRGPGIIVSLAVGTERLLARITRRSAQALDIGEGRAVWAIVKAVAIAPEDVGGPAPFG
jgi:molybdate transport system ATP-binding protein